MLLFCIALSVVLMQAGSLFLVDYIPVSHSLIKRIYEKHAHWQNRLAFTPNERNGIAEMPEYFDTADPDISWLVRQDNPMLIKALKQLQNAQQDYERARLKKLPHGSMLILARQVIASYRYLGVALEHDMEIKQSVISLLQLLGLLLIMSCIGAIALGARRVLVDRLDRLISFIPGKHIENPPNPYVDEFFHLEQRVFEISARLESYAVEATWANQTSERLRRMVQAQDFLFKLVEMINSNVISEITLRKLLYALEKTLNINNASIIFPDEDASISASLIVFSHHPPAALNDTLIEELMASGSSSFLFSHADKSEVRCLAVPFSSPSGAMSVLVIETEENRILDETEIQLVEITTALLTMVMRFQSRDQEGRRIALLEERAAIARELHDSLAQSLSFMKIQIARLQSDSSNQAAGNSHAEVVGELRAGLDNAYRELRELLATFRVHMDVRGLGFAIQSAIDEFSHRSSLSITLDNRLDNCRLTVNEEFHILHVVREALSNIVRHSEASNVRIGLAFQSIGSLMVTIDDDGVGYTPVHDGKDHYGHTIMQERAYSLGGKVEVMPRRKGGTRVRLVFTPKLAQ